MLNKKLPDTELKIMKCIWHTGYKTVISKDVADEIEKTYGWRHVHYTVLIKEREYLKIEGKRVFRGLHNNPLSELISKLHDGEEITEEKIIEIGSWIKSWKYKD